MPLDKLAKTIPASLVDIVPPSTYAGLNATTSIPSAERKTQITIRKE